MTEDVKTQQAVWDTENKAETRREGNTIETHAEAERARPAFNRCIFENLMSNLECQLEYWNRKAECQVDLQVAQAPRLKVEGLAYALRLLNAFEPEFRELVDCAGRATTDGTTQR